MSKHTFNYQWLSKIKRISGDPYLIEDFKNRVVRTNCGDYYLDYDIPFDDLFELVDYIKKTEKEMKEGK